MLKIISDAVLIIILSYILADLSLHKKGISVPIPVAVFVIISIYLLSLGGD